tara:strand:- start:3423 stop:4331 length:909 start_codon:yes stop_codon:yes gene_type:complete
MIKIINLNVILFSLAIAYGILKIINSYNDKKMEYSVGSEESLPEQESLYQLMIPDHESLADITAKFNAEMAKTKDAFKTMKEEIEKEVSNIHIPNKSSLRFSSEFLRSSFKYRLDNCVYKESEDESCKNGAVDLGIDKICCNIRVWDIHYLDKFYKENKLLLVPNSNITIDNKTYNHDFMNCVDGRYNSNGYYHINNLKVVFSPDLRLRNRYFHRGLEYWEYRFYFPVGTDFSCKLNVRRIDHAPGSISIHSEIDDHTAQISNIDEWNDEELKDYFRRAKRTPDAISEKFETEELDFGDEEL